MPKFGQANNKAAKLTGEQVLSIRQLYTTLEYSYADLSRQFGVSKNTIASIINGTSWQHVAGGGGTGLNQPPAAMSAADLDAARDRLLAAIAARQAPQEQPVEAGLDKLQRMAADKYGASAGAELDELMADDDKPTEETKHD